MSRYKLTLPYYLELKKNKKVMVGMNWYRNAHYHELNKAKKMFSELVRAQMTAFENEGIEIYRINYKMYYKRSNQDLMNVISVVDKFVQDSLQEIGFVINDTVRNCITVKSEVIEQDKKNPRIEIIIEKIK